MYVTSVVYAAYGLYVCKCRLCAYVFCLHLRMHCVDVSMYCRFCSYVSMHVILCMYVNMLCAVSMVFNVFLYCMYVTWVMHVL